MYIRFLVLSLLLVSLVLPAAGQVAPHRVSTTLMDPREHPDYGRRHVKPPSWDTFGNRTQFAALRGFTVEKDEIKGYADEIEKYTNTFALGNVIWPAYPIIFAKNLGDLADEIKKRGLFLFDLWGYVPGSGPGGYWEQYKAPRAALDLLESRLGDHWLGMDVGEQDGRYIGGYAGQMYPISGDRAEQYLNFQRHFQGICDDLGNRMSVLVSLNYGHYMLKEGVYATIGAETAQGLPNSQVYYAFIRGAGKQYGVPWFGNASVFNRWGYKTYGSSGPDHSPTKGSSLSLLKRLMYQHILYNSVFVGFESGWFDGAHLSPIGKIQQAAQKWVKDNGPPGVMQTPVAIMVDFFAGWTFPRHLYSDNVYRVWGNIPYDMGDYLTDSALDMIYPGYQDSSYFHDERGFIAPTPYGDIADCLLSDAPEWILDRYPMIILAGRITPTAELCDKLDNYMKKGGCLVTTAGNLACVMRTENFSIEALQASSGARVLAKSGDKPAVVEAPVGAGRVIAFASEWGTADAPSTNPPIRSEVDKPLPKPRPLQNQVRETLDRLLREQMLFEAGEGLSVIVCRKPSGPVLPKPGPNAGAATESQGAGFGESLRFEKTGPLEYTLGICNNALEPRPFKIVSHCGAIESVKELPLDQSEKTAVGNLPEGHEAAAIGTSSDTTIAGGDIRIFVVKVHEAGVAEIPHAAPPAPPKGRILPLRSERMIQEEILLRPTFFQHYDGMSVDWRYLHRREANALKQEAPWLARQGARIWVDLTSGINLFPDLRLIDNDHEEFAASMKVIEDVLDKMPLLNARDLILSLHRTPENNFTPEQTHASFVTTLKDICGKAAAKNIAVYLRMSPKGNGTLAETLRTLAEVGAPNLRLAPSIAMLVQQKPNPADAPADLKAKTGVWLASGLMDDSIAGTVWSVNAPVTGHATPEQVRTWINLLPDVPIVFDGVYANQNEEYRDARLLERSH